MALQLLLRYPVPPDSQGPYTFVDDALYLRDHLTTTGGATIIFKYTGKQPLPSSSLSSAAPPHSAITSPGPGPQPQSPASPSKHAGFGSLRQRTLGARSPLSSLQHPGGVEALLSGAAKNMIERGEKLGINQAVRDAMGEIKKGLQEARSSSGSRTPAGRGSSFYQPPQHTVTSMQRRNRQLAAMLDESITSLKQLAASGLGLETADDKEKRVETVEMAAAKIQFVKACLEDSSLILPDVEEGVSASEREPQAPLSPPPSAPAFNALSLSPSRQRGGSADARAPTVALDTTPVVMTSSVVEEDVEAGADAEVSISQASTVTAALPSVPGEGAGSTGEVDEPPKTPTEMINEPKTSNDSESSVIEKQPESPPSTKPAEPTPSSPPTNPDPLSSSTFTPSQPQQEKPQPPPTRPQPLPTRSTIAQSSFAWMLEPDDSVASPLLPGLTSPRSPTSAFPELLGRSRRPSTSASSSHAATETGSKQKQAPRKKSLVGGSRKSHHKMSSSSNASRERNAFLFGDEDGDDDDEGGKTKKVLGPLERDGIFGLEVISRTAKEEKGGDGGGDGSSD